MDNLNLLVTLYTDHYQHDDNNTNRNMFNYITWSPYDRIVFTKAKSLKELCGDNDIPAQNSKEEKKVDNDQSSSSWTGVKQCMHLIEERFDGEKPYSSNWILKSNEEKEKGKNKPQSDDDPIFAVATTNESGDSININYAFHCIYSMRFSKEIQNLKNGDQIYDKKSIRKEVYKRVRNETKGKGLDFRCFRSLGSEDMVIIFLAHSMKDIVTTVNHINGLKIDLPAKLTEKQKDHMVNLFSTVCVFSGFNDPKYSKETDLDLIIHLNLKHNDSTTVFNDLKKEIKKRLGENAKLIISRRSVFLGIAAIKLYIRAGRITYNEFHNIGVFNGSSDFYKNNIYSSRTYFCIPGHEANENGEKDFTVNVMNLDSLSLLKPYEDKDKNEDKYKHQDKDEKDDGKRLERINPVADFVFGEYERLLSSQRTFQWYEILSKQYAAVKAFMEYYSENNDTFDECALLNYAQSSLHLINQACSPVSEVPNHNHFYAGSFHDLIKSYYGIINMLFTMAYNLPHAEGNYQHPITFAICLNSVARIESKIFTRHDDKNRIVIFFLPYDSFWNYADNIKLLVHETFHYVAPYDRSFRASCFVKIIYNLLTIDRIHRIAKDKIPLHSPDNDSPNEIDISYKISEWIDYIVRIYDDSNYNIEKDLLSVVRNQFPNFFIHSNPEWSMLYLDESYKDIYPNKTEQPNPKHIIENIIFVIDNYVKQVIEDYHNEAMKKLSNASSEDTRIVRKEFTVETVRKKLQELKLSSDSGPGLPYGLYKDVRRKIKMYDLATKEAFCDLWSISLSGLTIPQYLAFLLKTMSKVYKPDDVLDGIEAVELRQTKMDIRGTVIRMLLLIHKYVNDMEITNISEVNLPWLLLEKYGKKDSSDIEYLSQCFEVLARKYIEYATTIAKYEIDSACNIAFHKVDEALSDIDCYDKHQCCSYLREIAATDLHRSIRMDQIDRLSNYIGEEEPNKKAANGKIPAFIHYERIGEDKQYKMLVSSFGEFMEAVEQVNKKVSKERQTHILWYRGVCSDRFSLLPSIFRKGNLDLSIYANQANVIKRAYFSTLYASDIWNLPIEQRMAYLQHYGMPTNLLDFSIDPLTALHFAVNPDVAADKQNLRNGTHQPVVYVFDPMIYSRAIRRMSEWNPNLFIPDTISSVNFDINSSPNERSEFFVEDMSYDYLYEHNNRHSKTYSPDDRGDPFPVPIVIQQSNPRIIAQSGTFVAFSLHAQPQKNTINGKFDYLNLLKIQERYLNFLNQTSNFEEQFIFPIYLRKSYIASLREELKFLNISTGKFYPELNKVFEDTGANGLNDGI